VSRFDATAEAGARLPLFDVGVTIPTRKTERGARAIAEVCGRIDYIQPGESSLLARKIAGGAVAVLRDGVEIAAVTEPGAVFGELSVLLDQPHAAAATSNAAFKDVMSRVTDFPRNLVS
jgi:hypothetical protein